MGREAHQMWVSLKWVIYNIFFLKLSSLVSTLFCLDIANFPGFCIILFPWWAPEALLVSTTSPAHVRFLTTLLSSVLFFLLDLYTFCRQEFLRTCQVLQCTKLTYSGKLRDMCVKTLLVTSSILSPIIVYLFFFFVFSSHYRQCFH